MPFRGRNDSDYPIYPQFGSDPTKFNNILAVTFEKDSFLSGDTLNFQLKTGDSEIRVYDLVVEFIDGEVDFTITEGATCTDGVTLVTPGSSDRNSPFVSSVFASYDPTAISGGIIVNSFEHFGLPSPIIGFVDLPPSSVNYVTLKLNTNYIFKFVNVSPVTIIDFRFLLLWAE